MLTLFSLLVGILRRKNYSKYPFYKLKKKFFSSILITVYLGLIINLTSMVKIKNFYKIRRFTSSSAKKIVNTSYISTPANVVIQFLHVCHKFLFYGI